MAQRVLPVALSDPMSGYFLLPRPLFERLAPDLTAQGFKILLDLLLSSRTKLRIAEIPCQFHPRTAGHSKLDVLVLVQFAALLLDKATRGMLPLRFVSFALVGAVGIAVHLTVLTAARAFGATFEVAQIAATLVATIANFQLNNVITYRDSKLRGPGAVAGAAAVPGGVRAGRLRQYRHRPGAVFRPYRLDHLRTGRGGDRAGLELRRIGDPGMARALILLFGLTALRLLVAGAAPLSPDEAYYWVWSRALQPGYLDHPPMVALWIRLGTALAGQGAFGIRLLGPLSAALGSVLLVQAGNDLFPARKPGLVAAVLLNTTLLMAAGSVTMTPDTPLLFFWTATLWALARLIATGRPAWWLAVGVFAGAALDSKYTAALLGVGIALWLVAVPEGRRWLRTIWPWAGGVLAGLCFAPVLWWNAAHGWASFAKQGGRTGDWHPTDALRHIAELLGSQLGLGTPIVALLCAAGIFFAARRWRQGPAPALLAALTLPGILVFLQHAVGDRVQANWPAILFPAACIAAACYVPRFWRPAAALGFVVAAVVYLQAATAILPLPRAMDPTLIRLAGWDDLARQVDAAHPPSSPPTTMVLPRSWPTTSPARSSAPSRVGRFSPGLWRPSR